MAQDQLEIPAKSPNELIVSEETVPDGTTIWRYLKYERFVDILKTHGLWFSRPFVFEDQWEGLFPPSYIRRTRQFADANDIPFEEFQQDFRRRLLRHRYAHFVSCWHTSDHESDAMWRLYALPKTGIAIQSTVGDVKECLRPHNSGKVVYYDPSHDVRSPTMVGPHDILFKRKPFSWEHEYRFWFDDDDLLREIETGRNPQDEGLAPGRLFPIGDMRQLIRKIVVAPGAPDNLVENLRAACAEHKKHWLWDSIEGSYVDRMWDSFAK